jgi:Protein of unknown function (DUF3300)
MNSKPIKQSLRAALCLGVSLASLSGSVFAFQDQDQSSISTSPPPPLTPFSTTQLDAMVAPIALYPDALVAQVLAATLYPDQIAFADDWVGQNKGLTGSALSQAVSQQPWDPSVQALTQFPSVLHNLARNLAWTSNLGQAFTNQQPAVMDAVQVMRAKAQRAGTLQSSGQIKVVQQSPQTIVIQPANPQVVYVPQYNPAVVFGPPVAVPLYTPPVTFAAASVSFGAGVAIGASIGGGVGFGFSSWNCSWSGPSGGGGNVTYNNNTYVNKTVVNNTNNNFNNYHPWGPGPHPSPGPGPNNGPHPFGPPSGQPGTPGANNNQDMPGANGGGVQHLIGGNGGVQHFPNGGQEPNNNQHLDGANGGGVQHLIGGNGGVQHFPNAAGNGGGGNGFNPNWQQHPMTGNGNQARAEANRGATSMARAGGGPPQAGREEAMRRR